VDEYWARYRAHEIKKRINRSWRTARGVFVLSMVPLMIFFEMHHVLHVDHITATDNLVRMHNVRKRSRWVDIGFILGHSASVFVELAIIIYVVGSATGEKIETLSFWGNINFNTNTD
jgi:nickel/cobalt transporter (NiCoT) family protein